MAKYKGPKMDDADRKALTSVSKKTLAEWWCQLNSWTWPSGIPNKPKSYCFSSDHNGRAWEIMDWIKRKVGDKVIHEEWEEGFI